MATAEQGFERSIERELRKVGIKYVKAPIVGKTQPDFLVTTPLGDRIIIEAKAWPRSKRSMERAANQANVYARLSGAVGALLVTPTSAVFCSADGDVTSLPNLESALSTFSRTRTSRETRSSIAKRSSRRKRVFASMPFAAKYDDTFLVAISPAALALNATAHRIDRDGEGGDVVAQIKAMIRQAKVVVADLSESRPSVCHEIGYAEALGRPVIQICSTPVKKLPFNLRNNQTITYSIGQSAALKLRLQKRAWKDALRRSREGGKEGTTGAVSSGGFVGEHTVFSERKKRGQSVNLDNAERVSWGTGMLMGAVEDPAGPEFLCERRRRRGQSLLSTLRPAAA